MKWNFIKIGEVASIIDGDRGKNYPKQNEFLNIGYCLFLNTGNVTKDGFSFKENQFITKEKDGVMRKGKLERGDIIFTSRGTIGNVAYYDHSVPYDNVRINSGMVILRASDDCVEQRYLYQLLKSNYQRARMFSYITGSAQPQLPIKNFSQIEIPLPRLPVQRRIADILSAYDDLIENNQKQIKLLEEAAVRLYKEWFVYLRFPGHENTPIVDGVPEGWREISIGKLLLYEIGGGWGQEIPTGNESIPAYVIRGTDIDPFLYGNIRSVPYRYHSDSNLSSRQLQDGDIIFEVSGGSKKIGVAKTLLIRQSVLDAMHAPVMCASFCKVMRTIKKEHSQFLYTFLQYIRTTKETEKFEKRSASSIVNYRWKDFLAQQNILIPNDNILRGFNNNAENIYQKQIILSIQIEKIQEARDKLLPKLMSGEIEV